MLAYLLPKAVALKVKFYRIAKAIASLLCLKHKSLFTAEVVEFAQPRSINIQHYDSQVETD